MRRLSSTLLLSCVCVLMAHAQESAVLDSCARPVTCVVSARLGSSKVRDTYLTPLAYSGHAWAVQMERWRVMSSLRWIAQQRLDLDFSVGDIASGNSSMWAGRLSYRYGLMRRYEVDRRWSLSVGPYAGAEVGFDYNLKLAAGNNPATVRLCSNVGLSLAGSTHYTLRQQDCSVLLQCQAPLLGAAMMPEYGASYYETFLLQTTDHNAHFTSLHNQQDLDIRLTTDVPLAVICRRWTSTVRLGAAYHIETMRINDVTTRYSTLGVVLGWVYQYLPYHRQKSHYLNSAAHEVF